MDRHRYFLLIGVGLGICTAEFCRGEPALDESGAKARLMWFLGDEEQSLSIMPLIDQLDAESFAEREAATSKLAALPSLPVLARRLASTDKRLEVRSRLRRIAELHPVEKETERLNGILKQIADEKIPGTIGMLAKIVAAGAWDPDRVMLARAARATVTAADLPLLKESLASQSPAIRQLAAAAYTGLPAGQSADPLGSLLDDADGAIALLAAEELARRHDPACLRAFARLLDSTDFYTRHRSWSALKGLSDQAFGYDPSAPENARQAAARRWREWTREPGERIVGELPEATAIALLNGTDLTGWTVFENGRPAPARQTSWEARDGVLRSVGNGFGDIRTTAAFENYVLTLRYRIEDVSGDGGVGVMLTAENENAIIGAPGDSGKYLEVQLLPRRAGDLYMIGGFQAQSAGRPITFSSPRTAEVDDPAAQWHDLKLTVRDGDLKVEVNGTTVNQATGGSKGPGKIILRNEGDRISYKDILLHPIDP